MGNLLSRQAPSLLAAPKHERVTTLLSQLPDISLLEFDFLDSSFFRDLNSDSDSSTHCRELPSPEKVLDASGRSDGIWHFPELNVLVKYGHKSRVRLEEALALRVINKLFPVAEVPVPEVFGWKSTGKTGDESNFIYMSFLPGQRLKEAWETLTGDEKLAVSRQLGQIVDSLRAIEQDPADQFIGSVNRGPVQDIYFSPNHHEGPFTSARDFHDFVQFVSVYMVPVANRPPEPYRAMLPDTARICLTHGDLNLGNILVAISDEPRQVRVSGIVDWEQAGWYPEYWEYCKAMIVGPYGDEWRDAGFMQIALQTYEREYEAFEEYWSWKCP